MAKRNLRSVPDADAASYDELVRRGREARKVADNHQWIEGDLALEVEALTPGTQPRDEHGSYIVGESLLKRYADDIEVDYSTLKGWRQVAAAWPADRRRTAVSWAAHAELAAVTDRFDHLTDGMTKTEARELSKRLRGIGVKSGRHVPGWFELAGIVGDDLIAAQKHTGTFEAAVTRQPNKDLRAKLERYAGIAREVADRLDAVREWRVEEEDVA